MLLRDSPAPATGIFMSKRFGLADAGKRIGEDSLDKFERFQRRLSVILDPPDKVLAELWQEVDHPLCSAAHRLGLSAAV